MDLLARNKCFGGEYRKYQHKSTVLGCEMKFSCFVPSQPKPAILVFLSGLTCNEDNFITKAGAIQYAAQYGLLLVCPDTSPRNLNIPGDKESWDFGEGAGFYVDATELKWKQYQMFSYVNKELFDLVRSQFENNGKISIFGHSMGGHGALVSALKTQQYTSVSAFAPISNPTKCPWGVKAFTGYLGPDTAKWVEYDAAELLKKSQTSIPILVDYGTADNFLKEQLLVESLVETGKAQVRAQEGYDHSYWFIQTFIHDHLAFHHKHLSQ
ncbi:putative S-formylglutathione hydrolase, partial [Gorgonomyces haynaldii]